MSVLDGDDWRAAAWSRLVNAPGLTGQAPTASRWSMLNLDYADFQESRAVRAMPE